MNCTSLHHIEMCLSNSAQAFNFFTSRLGFRLVAVRDTSTCSQKVLRQQNIILVLTQRKEGHCNGNEENTCNNGVHFKSDILTNTENEMSNGSQDVHAPKCPEIGKVIESDGVQRNEGRHSNGRHVTTPKRHANTHEEHFTVFCCRNNSQHTIDSVFNAAVVVTNVHEVTERVKKMGGEVIRNPTVVSDDLGQVTYSIIATGFGNSVHTLIDKTKYTGKFLPGFTKYESEELEPTVVSNEDLYFPLTTHMDHIAYVCEEGQSQAFIRWYEQVFCMKRFLVNREENLDTGLAIEGTVGLRLRALEYWRCSETGLYIPSHGDTSLKIVVAEPITSIHTPLTCSVPDTYATHMQCSTLTSLTCSVPATYATHMQCSSHSRHSHAVFQPLAQLIRRALAPFATHA
ncbi:Glyoxalase/Bleomycin resistance protein/Dihydroxybiphenyl dioxygenase [Trinorchestia longiramus]|nr:Glyoxalase/Bleomycin resistance protein/Dihydroxybiphenyl dioxygenase [Trinorchestia longiramus]